MSYLKYTLLAFGIFTLLEARTQSYVTVNLEEEYLFLVEEWDEISEGLSTYYGLSAFCTNEEYRTQVLDILDMVHYYDSIVLDVLKDPTTEIQISSRKYGKMMDELFAFSDEHSKAEFISFMRKFCVERNNLEKDKDALKHEVGMYSYDGQILLIETDLNKYMKRMAKGVESINEYVQELAPSTLEPVDVVVNYD
ncbi:hypothetical protein SAMN05421640_2125 [Ekhidna lutea]|uniref:Uncharacterized protein n=1 Tax=Ekhidna lutea TaxID=447679 RepID=A0A239JFD2_EKHLU|nr:hypothetical protein [Ekhidna lutea]SNT04128.1 hypothetical protein SAMN05421640_2125 [Ekhidna lutea]